MRDFVLLAVILGSAPLCFLSPFFGVLMWYWIAYFNPHRFTWSYAYDFPVAAVIAVPTLVGALIERKPNRVFQVRETFLLLALWAWCLVSFLHAVNVPLFAGHMVLAKEELERFSKILLMTFVMLLLVNSRQRLRALLVVTAGSLGLLAVRGAIFGLRTGGEFRVWGPPKSFLADNNGFALALNMSLPIFYFLAREEENRFLRVILRLFLFVGIVSVILTYSRGGLLGLAVVLAAITFKTRRKVIGALLLAVSAFLVLTFAPAQWMTRMDTFLKGDLDRSANQRLIAWQTAWRFAQQYPVIGGGFDTLPDVEIFRRYQPEPLPGGYLSTGPHNIYVQFMVDQGFVGLGLFLLLLGSSLSSLRSLRRAVRPIPSAHWITNYSHMIEVSLLGYMVSGAFLGLGYFDLAYQVVATTIILRILYRQEAQALSLSKQDAVAAYAVQQQVAV